MKRINTENLNCPELSDVIFHEKWYDDIHTIDLPRFEELAKKFAGGEYLDVGCFNSPMPGLLANKGNEVWAIDYAPKVITTLKGLFPKVNYICIDFMSLPFKDDYFDYIVAGEVIEHLEDPTSFIKELKRVLKPGGMLAISCPFEELISQDSVSKEHLWGFTEDDLRKLLLEFKEIETSVMRNGCLVFIAYARK